MQIDNNYSPVFGAKFINSVTIGKLQQGAARYCDYSASFVEIEPNNIGDINALEYVSKNWSYAKFADNIYHAACALKNGSKFYKDNKVFALTAQQDKFEKLRENDLLGLVHVGPLEDNSLFIEHLQVNPDIIYVNKPDYRGVGTGVLNSLKKLTDKISLFPSSEKSVRDFYEKNGFFEYPVGVNIFTWAKDLFPRL